MNKMVNPVCFIILVAVTIQTGGCERRENDLEDEDPVDRILRERGLKSPHEMGTKDEIREQMPKNMMCTNENAEIKHLKNDLKECNEKKGELVQRLVQNAVNESLQNSPIDTPYLKQIYRSILHIGKNPHDPMMPVENIAFKFSNESFGAIKSCLNDEKDVQDCTDVILNILKTGTIDAPSHFVERLLDILAHVNLTYVLNALIAFIFSTLVLLIAIKLISSNQTFLGMMIILLFLIFMVSVPWEWMRMYKEAIAKKTEAKISVPPECFQEKLSYVSLIKFWLRDSFSFSDSACLRYYESVTVDPFWDVTPGQAMSAAASRIFLHPMLIFSEYFGKCFRLIFKEIPVQWQPVLFIGLFITILFGIGIQVYTPFLRIGRDGQDVRGQLEAERDRNRQLTQQIDQLHKQIAIREKGAREEERVPAIQNGRENVVVQRQAQNVQEIGARNLERSADFAGDDNNDEMVGVSSEFVMVPPNAGLHLQAAVVENNGYINGVNTTKEPTENECAIEEPGNARRHLVNESRNNVARNEEQNTGGLQETENIGFTNQFA